MEHIKKHFQEEAAIYDRLIENLIPFYREMVTALIDGIPFPANTPLKVLDLGCGTGNITRAVKKGFPASRVTCLDISENMIEMARIKLADLADITFENGDFSKLPFDTDYDIVISSLAIHHLETDTDKQQFYSKIHKSLAINGVFINADNVKGSNDYLDTRYIERWIAFMERAVSREEIDSKWIPAHKSEDRPAPLVSQLDWLRKAGFDDVDVIWKYYNFAVFCATRK